jgi:hypothetical protein
MAKLTMSSSEPVKIIKLIEQMFPGVKLDAMEQIIEGVAIEGDIKLTKSLAKDTSVILEVIITPG